jgi:hemoglobin-like flavoprotein
MTDTQITIVKKTWKLFRAIDPAIVGDTFYSKLFTDNPVLRRMFPSRMEEQYRKLIDMLNTIVARLDHPDKLNTEIIKMGQRHVEYGVRPAHYKLVGNALLWTLQNGLGADWTDEVRNAWTSCYGEVAAVMMGTEKLTS